MFAAFAVARPSLLPVAWHPSESVQTIPSPYSRRPRFERLVLARGYWRQGRKSSHSSGNSDAGDILAIAVVVESGVAQKCPCEHQRAPGLKLAHLAEHMLFHRGNPEDV